MNLIKRDIFDVIFVLKPDLQASFLLRTCIRLQNELNLIKILFFTN